MEATLGKKFKKFRKTKKISQIELSKRSGVSRHTILRFENGGIIKSNNLESMLDVLDGTLIIIDI